MINKNTINTKKKKKNIGIRFVWWFLYCININHWFNFCHFEALKKTFCNYWINEKFSCYGNTSHVSLWNNASCYYHNGISHYLGSHWVAWLVCVCVYIYVIVCFIYVIILIQSIICSFFFCFFFLCEKGPYYWCNWERSELYFHLFSFFYEGLSLRRYIILVNNLSNSW